MEAQTISSRECCFGCVQVTTKNGMPEAGQVDTQLVTATGYRIKRHQRGCTPSVQHRELRQRCLAKIMIHHLSWSVNRIRSHRQINLAFIIRYQSPYLSNIDLIDEALTELPVQVAGGK